jgi:hypothetical protein
VFAAAAMTPRAGVRAGRNFWRGEFNYNSSLDTACSSKIKLSGMIDGD